jgi:uncharacterized membrane protein YraQ (UPF0718 family)
MALHTLHLVQQVAGGVVVGIIMLAVVASLPQSAVLRLAGVKPTAGGLGKAIAAGLLLDLCSHGILMVATKLYKQGLSTPQMVAFLITSPWNSLSLLLILAGLIGWLWTLTFLVLSAVVGFITGWLLRYAEQWGWIDPNPYHPTAETLAQWQTEPPLRWQNLLNVRQLTPNNVGQALKHGLADSVMVLRWLLFGIALAALLHVLVPTEVFGEWFGPTALGLLATLVLATVLEVCSEGSSPIAADVLLRANAPGNAFVFLMAGAATDSTELLVLRQLTNGWRVPLLMVALSVPQVLLLGWVLNQLG